MGPIDQRASMVRRRLCACAVLAMAATTLVATPAGAKVVDREAYQGSDGFSYDCVDVGDGVDDFTVDVEVTFEGRYHLRAGTGRLASAFFVHDNYSYTETHSANGTFFTLSGNVVFKETRAVPLGNNLFEFHSIEAGQPFVVRDMDGTVLVRDRGVIRYTILFDTLGDDEPGGEFVEEIDVRVAGPHPGLLLGQADACHLLVTGGV